MRELAIRGGPFSPRERHELIDYCQGDVEALTGLLPHLTEKLDLGQALLRGRYMKSAARMEYIGIPVDVETLEQVRANWDRIKEVLIRRVDANYSVFEGNTFKVQRFALTFSVIGFLGLNWRLAGSQRRYL